MSSQLELHDLDAPMINALDKVRHGEEVTVSYHGQAVAKLVPPSPPRKPEFGSLKGMIEMSEDFNAPLPEDELREWEK